MRCSCANRACHGIVSWCGSTQYTAVNTYEKSYWKFDSIGYYFDAGQFLDMSHRAHAVAQGLAPPDRSAAFKKAMYQDPMGPMANGPPAAVWAETKRPGTEDSKA